tara:strand:- start:93 stop:242 length:150 start_codon:yes stop_codon:yes gene_type:complete
MKQLWNAWGPLFMAVIIAVGVVYFTIETEWVTALEHNLKCSGAIGGGCE